jgi:hypothetical protein
VCCPLAVPSMHGSAESFLASPTLMSLWGQQGVKVLRVMVTLHAAGCRGI